MTKCVIILSWVTHETEHSKDVLHCDQFPAPLSRSIKGGVYTKTYIYIPRCSMHGIFTYIYYHQFEPNVGKYTIHGSYGIHIYIYLYMYIMSTGRIYTHSLTRAILCILQTHITHLCRQPPAYEGDFSQQLANVSCPCFTARHC